MGDRPGVTAAQLLGADPRRLLTSTPWPTGFDLLDHDLAGGLHGGELTLIAGAPGLGKTTLALQMARNIALTGGEVLYVCYEHSEEELLTRLLLMESGLAHPDEPALGRGVGREPASADAERRLAAAVESLRGFGERIRLARGSGSGAGPLDVSALEASDRAVVFVDYLQKVPSLDPQVSVDERVAEVVFRLKDFALRTGVPVVALAASDKAGLDRSRLRLSDLKGSSALVYEADVVLILNDKRRIVARHHLVYGSPESTRFSDQVVCTIEKNRSGKAPIELELRKRFSHGCFDPEVSRVVEQLLDGRVFVD